jgi:hypothetical protein
LGEECLPSLNLVGVNPQAHPCPRADVIEPNPHDTGKKQRVNLGFPVQNLPGNRYGQSYNFGFHPLEVGFSLASEFTNCVAQRLPLGCQLLLKFCHALRQPFILPLFSGAGFPRSNLILANRRRTG